MTDIPYLLLRGIEPAPPVDWLTSREREIDEAFRFDKPRTEWRLGRWTGKRALACLLGTGLDTANLRRIMILPADDGAPEAFLDGLPAPCSLSLSHSGDAALCALMPAGGAVGCDVEGIDRRSTAFVDTFFTDTEAHRWRHTPKPERDFLATLIWSAKESALKGLREGLRMDTRDVEVTFESGPDRHAWQRLAVSCRKDERRWHGWWREHAGFALTMVAESPAATPLQLRDSA